MTLKAIKKQNVTDGRAYARRDGQRENSIPTPNKVCGGGGGGYNNQTKTNKKTTRKITLITYKVILTTRNNCYHLDSIDNQRPKNESLTLKIALQVIYCRRIFRILTLIFESKGHISCQKPSTHVRTAYLFRGICFTNSNTIRKKYFDMDF